MVEMPIDGIRVGHWTNERGRTGCTVVVFDQPAFASGEVRGGAPATREFELLDPRRTVQRIDAVVLSGGSAFGLAACDGVVTEAERDGRGFETDHGVVPIVVGMSLFDLGVGDASARPDAAAGASAWHNATRSFEVGSVGAGTGATVGKWRGRDVATAGGLGWATVTSGELVVSALVAVNAAGDLVAGSDRSATRVAILDGSFDWPERKSGQNTTIGVVMTNGTFSKMECLALAEGGHDGLARGIMPAHTASDGDAIVAVSSPSVDAEIGKARIMAAVVVESAIGSIAELGSVESLM